MPTPPTKKKKKLGKRDTLTQLLGLLMFLVNSEPESVFHSPRDLSLWEYSPHDSQAMKANGSGDTEDKQMQFIIS